MTRSWPIASWNWAAGHSFAAFKSVMPEAACPRLPAGGLNMGTLYIVPTPIGNLEDMTLRGSASPAGSVVDRRRKDTRVSRTLLRHFDINTPMTSYHEHNKLSKLDAIFAALDVGECGADFRRWHAGHIGSGLGN